MTSKQLYTFIDHRGDQDQIIYELVGKPSEGMVNIFAGNYVKILLNSGGSKPEIFLTLIRELALNETAKSTMPDHGIGSVDEKDVEVVCTIDLFEDHVPDLRFTTPLRKDDLLTVILSGREDVFENLRADFSRMDGAEISELTRAATLRNDMWFLELAAQKLSAIPYTTGLNSLALNNLSGTTLCLSDYWACLNRAGRLAYADRYTFVEEKLSIKRVDCLRKAVQYIEEFELGQAEIDYVMNHVSLDSLLIRDCALNVPTSDLYSLTKYAPPEQARILGLSRYKLSDLFTCKLLLKSTDAISDILKKGGTDDVEMPDISTEMKNLLEIFFRTELDRIGADALSEQIWRLLNQILSCYPASENDVGMTHYHEALVSLAEVVPLDEQAATNITGFFNSEGGHVWFDRSNDIWQLNFTLVLFRRLGCVLSSDKYNSSKFQVYDTLEWWMRKSCNFPDVVRFIPTDDMLRNNVLTYDTLHWWSHSIHGGDFTTDQLRGIKVCGVPLGYVKDHHRGDDLLRLFTICDKVQVIRPSILLHLFSQLNIAVTLDEDLCDLMVIIGEGYFLCKCARKLSSRSARVTNRVYADLVGPDIQDAESRISRRVAFLSWRYEIELSQEVPRSGKTGLELYQEARAQFQEIVTGPPPVFSEYHVHVYDDDEGDSSVDAIALAIELSTHFTPAMIRSAPEAQQIIAGFSHPVIYSPTDICALCLEALGADHTTLIQTPCGHIYHNTTDCNLLTHLIMWSTCPLCRAAIVD